MLHQKFKQLGIGLSILLVPLVGFAQTMVVSGKGGAPTLGVVASNMHEATDIFNGIFSAMFYVIGIALVVTSIMRYRDFRQNPTQTPISRVIVILLAGLAIGFFPFIVNYLSGATSSYNV